MAETNVNIAHYTVRIQDSDVWRRAVRQIERSLMTPCYGQNSHIREDSSLTASKHSGNYTYRQDQHPQIFMFCTRSAFMYFLWIWEKTAIISQYNINWWFV